MLGIGRKVLVVVAVIVVIVAALAYAIIAMGASSPQEGMMATVYVTDEESGFVWESQIKIGAPTPEEQAMLSLGGGIRMAELKPAAAFTGEPIPSLSKTKHYHIDWIVSGKLSMKDISKVLSFTAENYGMAGGADKMLTSSRIGDSSVRVNVGSFTNYVPTSNNVVVDWNYGVKGNSGGLYFDCYMPNAASTAGVVITGQQVNGMKCWIGIAVNALDLDAQPVLATDASSITLSVTNWAAGIMSITVGSISTEVTSG